MSAAFVRWILSLYLVRCSLIIILKKKLYDTVNVVFRSFNAAGWEQFDLSPPLHWTLWWISYWLPAPWASRQWASDRHHINVNYLIKEVLPFATWHCRCSIPSMLNQSPFAALFSCSLCSFFHVKHMDSSYKPSMILFVSFCNFQYWKFG